MYFENFISKTSGYQPQLAVLGKRRRKTLTGGSMALLIWIITMSVAMGGAITSSTMLSLENGRKRRRRR